MNTKYGGIVNFILKKSAAAVVWRKKSWNDAILRPHSTFLKVRTTSTPYPPQQELDIPMNSTDPKRRSAMAFTLNKPMPLNIHAIFSQLDVKIRPGACPCHYHYYLQMLVFITIIVSNNVD